MGTLKSSGVRIAWRTATGVVWNTSVFGRFSNFNIDVALPFWSVFHGDTEESGIFALPCFCSIGCWIWGGFHWFGSFELVFGYVVCAVVVCCVGLDISGHCWLCYLLLSESWLLQCCRVHFQLLFKWWSAMFFNAIPTWITLFLLMYLLIYECQKYNPNLHVSILLYFRRLPVD